MAVSPSGQREVTHTPARHTEPNALVAPSPHVEMKLEVVERRPLHSEQPAKTSGLSRLLRCDGRHSVSGTRGSDPHLGDRE